MDDDFQKELRSHFASISRNAAKLSENLSRLQEENTNIMTQLGIAWIVMAHESGRITTDEAARALEVSIDDFCKCSAETMAKGMRMFRMIQDREGEAQK